MYVQIMRYVSVYVPREPLVPLQWLRLFCEPNAGRRLQYLGYLYKMERLKLKNERVRLESEQNRAQRLLSMTETDWKNVFNTYLVWHGFFTRRICYNWRFSCF
jgi:hypothetical protein